MSDYFISIKFQRRTDPNSPFPFVVRSSDNKEIRGYFNYVLPKKTKKPTDFKRIKDPFFEITAKDLTSRLFYNEIKEFVEQAIIRLKNKYFDPKFILEIQTSELFPIPWERILEVEPLINIQGLQLVRFSPHMAELALVPFSLPIDILIAGLALPKKKPDYTHYFWNPYDGPLKYFRSSIFNGLYKQDLKSLLSGRDFEVFHVQGYGHWRKDGQGVLKVPENEGQIDAEFLKVILRKSQTRLLILEAYGDEISPLLDLGHRILGHTGPTILVVSSQLHIPSSFFNEFYFNITHDISLNNAVKDVKITDKPFTSLMQAIGGESLLLLSPIASQFRKEGESYVQLAENIKEKLNLINKKYAKIKPARKLKRTISKRYELIEDDIPLLEDLTHTSLLFEHETGGLKPLTDISRRLKDIEKTLGKTKRYTDRVVNAWFASESRPISQDESLQVSGLYEFKIQIGRRSEINIIRGPKAIPEKELERFYSKEGLELDVVLSSDEFVIKEPVKKMKLPRPPYESKEVTFELTAPEGTGLARLRAGIYYKNNLLQSILIKVAITKGPQRGLSLGNRAEVEFALNSSLSNIDQYKQRTINVVTNEKPNGTHSFSIYGTGLNKQFNLTEGEIRVSISNARQKLQELCSTFDRKGRPDKYRFDQDNKGNESQFIEDLKKLANIGYWLFTDLITNLNDWEFEKKLKNIFRTPGKIIQVSSTKSAKYVFPWALIYDRDLFVESKKNVVCSTFLDDLRKKKESGFLENQTCMKGSCPSKDKSNVICPSGFWGFKHIIEQPLSVHEYTQNELESHMDLVHKIKIDEQLSLIMGVSRNLKHLDEHENEVKKFVNIEDFIYRSKFDIGEALKKQKPHVIYFYCHGGRSGARPWLGIGKNERLYPPDLKAWHIRWPVIHPLILINGCHTVDLTPDDLLHFNKMFAYCRAAGVIGTEINIPETLARHFAKNFFEDFLKGESIGKVMRQQRLLLLERYNPLGLVYTPYCSAELHIVH
ncbi:MAG: hypothetical protein ACETWK_06445 [Candidatus Aminicenantaceae bacterium]